METYEDLSLAIVSLIESKGALYGQEILSWIKQMQLAGATQDTIYTLMLADLNDGGRLFKPIENGLKNAIKDSLGLANNMASKKAYKDAGVQMFKWVTASGGKSCPDCAERAGRIDTMELWTAIGEPQSGFSVCRQHCRCKLVPAEYDGEESIEIKKIEQ